MSKEPSIRTTWTLALVLILGLGFALALTSLVQAQNPAADPALAQEKSNQGPVLSVWGQVSEVTGERLTVQTAAGPWSFGLDAATEYKSTGDLKPAGDAEVLANTGLEDAALDQIRVGDLVAVVAQLEGGEQSGLALTVVILPAEALGNLPPAAVQTAGVNPARVNAPALACQAQIDGQATIYASPQAAVDAAVGGDLIKISGTCTGVYARYGLTQTIYADKSLTFVGGYDAGFSEPPDPAMYPTALDAEARGRVLVVTETGQVRVENIDLRNGSAANLKGGLAGTEDAGGNIYVVTGTLSLVNGSIDNGHASFGGGVYAENSTVTIVSATVGSNFARSVGGGLYLSGTATISGALVINNMANSGGGVFAEMSSISITNSAFENNIGVGVGGGIFGIGGPLTITNSTFDNNLANGVGGGVFNDGGTITIRNSSFGRNRGIGTGGGVFSSGSTAAIAGSTFEGNYAAGAGAGLFHGGGPMAISSSTFSANLVSGSGAGAYLDGGPVSVADSTFRGNASGAIGAGIVIYSGTMTITNSTFDANTADSAGAGLLVDADAAVNVVKSTISGQQAGIGAGILNAGRLQLVNSTVSGNRAYIGPGGGIYNTLGATVTLTNATIAGNTAISQGAGIHNEDATVVLTMTNSVLAYQGSGGDCGGDFSNATSGGYNLSNDSSCAFLVAGGDISGTDPLLGPLQDNGGPLTVVGQGATETHAPLFGSPVLDHIPTNINGCGLTVIDDQRGVSRPQNTGCDSGAFEARTLTLTVLLTGTGSGAVTGPGIDCGSDCSESYLEQTAVTLAAGADPGSSFAGWGGACDGTADCALTMDAAKSVTATFDLILSRVYLPAIMK